MRQGGIRYGRKTFSERRLERTLRSGDGQLDAVVTTLEAQEQVPCITTTATDCLPAFPPVGGTRLYHFWCEVKRDFDNDGRLILIMSGHIEKDNVAQIVTRPARNARSITIVCRRRSFIIREAAL